MHQKEKIVLLLQLIAQKAATADGFFTTDAKFMASEKNAAKYCRQQAADGILVRVRVNQSTFAYFATQQLANAYMQRHRAKVIANAKSKISFATKSKGKPSQAAKVVRPVHIQTKVHPTPPQRNQVVALPAFIHNGYGAMR